MDINSAWATWGGAISLDTVSGTPSATLTIDNCSFTGNKATSGGGALNLQNGTTTISNTTFTNNSSTYNDTTEVGGGAIFADMYTSKVSIDSCVFSGNKANKKSQGGAIFSKCGKFTVSNSKFLTQYDTIVVYNSDDFTGDHATAGKVTFSDKNFIGASVTVRDSGTTKGSVVTSANAKTVFINDTAITFDGTIGSNNTIELNNAAAVTMSKGITSGTEIIVNAGVASSLVGDNVQVLTASSGLTNSTQVTYKGVKQAISAHDGLSLSGTTLSAIVSFYGKAAAENTGSSAETIEFVNTSYSESFSSDLTFGGDKVVTGSGAGSTSISGTMYAAGNTVSMSDLTLGGRIYGGAKMATAGAEGANNLTLNVTTAAGLRVNGAGNITALSGEVTNATGSTLNLTLAGSEAAGAIYGGAAINGKVTYNAGAINTTINGGVFGMVVGNGTSGNYDGTIIQGASTLTITGGTYNGRVYAGGYAMCSRADTNGFMALSEVIGDVTLNISGGTFNGYVYGGSCAQYNYVANRNISIHGNVAVNIDASVNTIKFNTAIFGGSQANGLIAGEGKGNTKVSLKGYGALLDFSGCVNGFGRIYGGSQNEVEFDDKSNPAYLKVVSGTRELEFDGFSGTLNAKLYNFDEVTFKGSEVILTSLGSGDNANNNDLHHVDVWNFDVSDDKVDLTWKDSGANNNFAGDVINLYGWDGETTRVFMAGCNSTLKGFKNANVNVYNGAGASVGNYVVSITSDNKLQIAKATA